MQGLFFEKINIMNNLKPYSIIKTTLWLLPWLCTIPLVSCSFDDGYEVGDNDTATLQLSITAREENGLNTRATGIEVGTDGEYMHNLCVLIVDQNNLVVKKLLPAELGTNTAAQKGNLKSWISDRFELATGTYTVYAFANIDTYYDGIWGSLTGLAEGSSLADLNVEDIMLDNPAGKLDFATGYFIPMSAKKTVNVTGATTGISIGLDRLVSKIRMKVNGRLNTTVNSLTFGGYADKIALFADSPLSGESYNIVRPVVLPENGKLTSTDAGATTGSLTIPDFYVNSSPAGHPFNVTVNTDELLGVTYNATTQRNELPRNSIYPLTLQLNDYGLDLAAQCWVSPIGSLPVEVDITGFDNTYQITVPEGCQFEFTVNGIKTDNTTSTTATNINCTWNIAENVTGIAFEGTTTGVQSIKGYVTASAGKTMDLKLLVTWTDNGATYNRTYTIRVVTDDITNFTLKTRNSGSAEFALDYLKREMLNMFKK